MALGDYKIESIYEPGYSSFIPSEDSPYLQKENLIPAKKIGMTTDPRTADQLSALSLTLNQGVIPVEISQISPDIFDTIPKQHFTEMKRKAKLAGAELVLHAPIQGMDPSGFGERGWQQSQQDLVERQLKDVMDKAALMDDKGNMPVTIHGSNYHGSTWKYVEDEETNKRKKVYETLMAVNKQTGEAQPIKEDKQFHPGGDLEKGSFINPEVALEMANRTQWRKETDAVLFEKETADKIVSEAPPGAKNAYYEISKGGRRAQEILGRLSTQEREKILYLQTAKSHIDQAELSVNSLFDKAYQYAEDDPKNIPHSRTRKEKREKLKKIGETYDRLINGGYLTSELESLRKKDEEKYEQVSSHRANLQNQSQSIQFLTQELKKLNPNMFTSVEKFSIEKASETFSNVALHSLQEHGERAPALSIENMDQGRFGFSQGKDIKNLIEKSREKFVKKAIDEGYSKKKAQIFSEKLIGATFDVGHLNISKKFGFTDKDLEKEAKEIAKFVNKVHLTDNFGYADTHLPIGMGNVPVKALLEALGEEGMKAVKINEVGGWFQHFKKSPFPQILEAAGSPIYSSGEGPYWSQAGGFQQSYLEGYGQMLPQTNYQLFGAGFSQLPSSLGGQTQQSGGGRMGGGDF